MERLGNIIINTPLWVWPLFIVLIALGYSCTKTRIVKKRTLYIMPTVYLALSIRFIYNTDPGFEVILGSLASGILGVFIGMHFSKRMNIQADHENALIQLPGEWITLNLIIVYFSIRYFYGYKLAVDPQLLVNTTFMLSFVSLFGCFSGFFIGRTIQFHKKYKTILSQALSKKK